MRLSVSENAGSERIAAETIASRKLNLTGRGPRSSPRGCSTGCESEAGCESGQGKASDRENRTCKQTRTEGQQESELHRRIGQFRRQR